MFAKSVLPGSSFEMCHHSIVTGAAAGDAAATDGAALAATDAATEGATDEAAGVLVAPLEQAPNRSAITLSTPTSRKRVVTA
jgi:hypothetical protein